MSRSVLALSLAFTALGASLAPAASLEEYRNHALRNHGDVERGRKLYHEDQRLLCAQCHSTDGSASKCGPDLFAAGDSFGRRDLVDAILHPSRTIAPGYGTVLVETTAGTMFQGVLKQANETGVQLMGLDGKLVSVPAAEIGTKTGTAISLMPEGQYAALSREEFTDLIEYLTTLKQPEAALASAHGAPAEIPPLAKPVTLTPFFETRFELPRGKAETGLSSMRQVPGYPDVFLVLHQKGVIWRVVKTTEGEEKTVFADLATEVFSERGPNGLLDVAFHPQFPENRKYYLFYQVFEDSAVVTRIIEKRFNDDFTADSGEPGREIITFVSVAEDHSGGCLDFGPDGFLYLVMGDTGPHNDPNGHAQNMQILLGKMMRIDVDHPADGRAYSIPEDNPFVGQDGVRPEIWASGLRNPWRFCFDRLIGDLWVADVGQDRVEEVHIVKPGENYGWNVYEGFEPFSNEFRVEGRIFTPPVFAYGRKYGNSITGGHVFRGDKDSSFYGVYICGDYNSKRLFGITQEDRVLQKAREIGSIPQQRLVSFSEDEAGTIYAIGYEGTIYRIDFSGAEFE